MTKAAQDDNVDPALERMRITDDGNVGIGIVAPSNKLHVYGTGPVRIENAGEADINFIDSNAGQNWQVGTNSNGFYVYDNSYRLIVKPTSGDVYLNNKHAFRSNDSWLRLNQDNAFANGTYTPGHLRADGGFTSGSSGNPGVGQIRATALSGGGNRIVMTDNNGTLYPSTSLVGTGLGDNLGNHVATTTLNMNNQAITNIVDSYNSGWYRNNNNLQGLYNQAVGAYFYASAANVWNMGGGGSYPQLIFRDNYQSTIRGYVYSDGGGFGLLHNGGGWAIRTQPGYQELYDDTYLNRARPYIIYDRDNSGYYWNGNGESRAYRTEAQRGWGTWVQYDANNTAYYVDPDGVSAYNDLRSNLFRDRANAGYYLDMDNYQIMTGTCYLSHTTSQVRVGHGYAPNYCVAGTYSCGWNGWSTCWSSCVSQPWYDKLTVYGQARAYSWAGWSDGRYKKNISTVTGALDMVKQMRGVTYDWKELTTPEEDAKRYGHGEYVADEGMTFNGLRSDMGVIAQEIQRVLPNAVSEKEVKDSSGVVLGTQFAVDYDNIIPVLIEAIKEQQIMIEELQLLAGLKSNRSAEADGLTTKALTDGMLERASGMSAEVKSRVKELVDAINEGKVQLNPKLKREMSEFIINGTLPQ
jgi:hypothetical protein